RRGLPGVGARLRRRPARRRGPGLAECGQRSGRGGVSRRSAVVARDRAHRRRGSGPVRGRPALLVRGPDGKRRDCSATGARYSPEITMKTTSSERRSLIIFLVGVALLAYLLARLGGWALPAVIAAVGLMVMGHEVGHFIVAKKSGMQVTDFFVGFGPVIWSTTRGETRYGVRALLLGGYVKVPGMSWDAKVEPELERRTYRSATYPRQVLFASAGSLMHVVMA